MKQQKAELRKVEADANTPLPTQLEGQLNIARAEWLAAEAALDKMTIRAPIAGTILQINAKAGELATPSASQPLVAARRHFGAARARGTGRARLRGDQGRAIGRGARRRRFAAARSPARCRSSRRWSSRRAAVSRGSRNVTDVDVVEVLVDLAEPGPLAVGMKVDVYFRQDSAAKQ